MYKYVLKSTCIDGDNFDVVLENDGIYVKVVANLSNTTRQDARAVCDALNFVLQHGDELEAPDPSTYQERGTKLLRVASIHLLLDFEEDGEACDFLSETLRDMPHVMDWGYDTINENPSGQATAAYFFEHGGDYHKEYSEGQFLDDLRTEKVIGPNVDIIRGKSMAPGPMPGAEENTIACPNCYSFNTQINGEGTMECLECGNITLLKEPDPSKTRSFFLGTLHGGHPEDELSVFNSPTEAAEACSEWAEVRALGLDEAKMLYADVLRNKYDEGAITEVTYKATFAYTSYTLETHPAGKQWDTWDAASDRQKAEHAAAWDISKALGTTLEGYKAYQPNLGFFNVEIKSKGDE
jgi:hypothetical protein